MDRLIETIILGTVQGLTEWLPISSTGHLEVFRHLLGLTAPLLFEIILHIGTLAVILTFFRKDVKDILSALAHLDFKSESGQLVPAIVVATIPTALIGVAYIELAEGVFQELLPVAVAFLLCGLLLYPTKTAEEKTKSMSYRMAVMIGIAQGIASIPGISRSGVTIAVALMLGLKNEKAFKFSFLLSIPAVLGALTYTFYKQGAELAASGIGWTEVFLGVAVAMLVGYFALKLLWKILTIKRFHLFAFYCWTLGAVLIALILSGVV